MNAITSNTPVTFLDPLPDQVDVLVIGGGVIGISAAYFLATNGCSVAVCEKGRVAGEQSSRNWGWVRQQGRDADELPLMMESLEIWRTLSNRVGEDVGFRQEGVLYLAETETELAELAAWLEVALTHGLDTRLLGARELATLVETGSAQWIGALYTPSDGRAEPWVAVPRLARAAQRLGVRLTENCAVRALDLAGGRVAGVVTELGRVRADSVILAGGAWCSLFLRHHGITLPQLSVRSTAARTAPARQVFAGNAADEKLAFRRREDGGYTVALCDYHEHFIGPDSLRFLRSFLPSLRASWDHTSLRPAAPAGYPDPWQTTRRWSEDGASPFEAMRVLDPPPCRRALGRITGRMEERLPALRGVAITDAWAGMVDATPDLVPVLDRAPSPDGLWIATGFSGHGFGIGPGAGRLMADLVLGRPPRHDLNRFRFSRFSDGSKLRLGPAL